MSTVEGLRDSVTSREKAEKELAARRKRLQADIKRFERRGRTERNRVERQVKKARTRVERELRQRRTRVEREHPLDPQGRHARRPTCSAPASRTSCRRASPAARRSPTKVQERVASVA